MKIPPVGAEFFHADGRAESQTSEYNETNSDFSKFCGCVWQAVFTPQNSRYGFWKFKSWI